MKPTLIFLVAAICASSGCAALHHPDPKAEVVSWEEMRVILGRCDVHSIYQPHAMWGYVTLKDGTEYAAREPYIDAILSEKGVPSKCDPSDGVVGEDDVVEYERIVIIE